MKRNILVITHTVPIPDLDGASLRIFRLMQMLIELGWSVTNLSAGQGFHPVYCLLYTSDAADERSSVDLGGRRILKKKNVTTEVGHRRLCRA